MLFIVQDIYFVTICSAYFLIAFAQQLCRSQPCGMGYRHVRAKVYSVHTHTRERVTGDIQVGDDLIGVIHRLIEGHTFRYFDIHSRWVETYLIPNIVEGC